jgi:hypothetical protein
MCDIRRSPVDLKIISRNLSTYSLRFVGLGREDVGASHSKRDNIFTSLTVVPGDPTFHDPRPEKLAAVTVLEQEAILNWIKMADWRLAVSAKADHALC